MGSPTHREVSVFVQQAVALFLRQQGNVGHEAVSVELLHALLGPFVTSPGLPVLIGGHEDVITVTERERADTQTDGERERADTQTDGERERERGRTRRQTERERGRTRRQTERERERADTQTD